MNKYSALAVLLLFGAQTGLVSAQDSEDVFSQLDKDGDGLLVAEEVSEAQRRFFDRLVRAGDENEDGKLSKAEYNATLDADERPVDQPDTDRASPDRRPGGPGRPEGGPGMFGGRFGPSPDVLSRWDGNKDGKLTKDEIPEAMQERMRGLFDRFGTDSIDLERLRSGAQNMSDRDGNRPPRDGDRPDGARRDGDRPEAGERDGDRPGFRGRDGDRPGFADRFRGPEGPPEGRGPMGDRGFGGGPENIPFMRVLDEDRDGSLSKEEALRVAKLFDELDRDNNGKLDGRELIGFGGGSRVFSAFGGDRPPFGERGFMGRDGDRPGRPAFGDRDRPSGDREREGSEEDRSTGGFRSGRGFGDQIGPEAFLERYDANQDGAISKDEAPEQLANRFDQIDENGDEKLTGEEFTAIFRRGGGRTFGGFGRGGREGDRPDRPQRPESEKANENQE